MIILISSIAIAILCQYMYRFKKLNHWLTQKWSRMIDKSSLKISPTLFNRIKEPFKCQTNKIGGQRAAFKIPGYTVNLFFDRINCYWYQLINNGFKIYELNYENICNYLIKNNNVSYQWFQILKEINKKTFKNYNKKWSSYQLWHYWLFRIYATLNQRMAGKLEY